MTTKRFPLCLILTLVLTSLMQAAFGQATIQSVYNDGIKLYKQQQFEDALKQFERILAAKPDHVYARSFATKCKTAIANNVGTKNDLEGQLAKIVIPQINFTDAPIGDVLQYLTSRAEELTKGKFVPNFIYKGTPEQRQSTLISLSLRNVPMTEAIRYVGQLSRTNFRYEEHAIVADPNYKEPANPALQETSSNADTGNGFGSETAKKSIFD